MNDIERQLAKMLRDPGIADEGFTEAVMGALPRRRMARSTARRLSLGAAAVSGGLLGALLGPPLEDVIAAVAVRGVDPSILALVLAGLLAAPFVLVLHGER
ncbi:MAG: hypothetical protein DIU62_003000 [Pseudomonadota bacterium]|jgi:hypothetical protein|nr:MAG: hypothetical protein DIU62_07060 [Pseudomonadota bacterium]